ncbi:MAG: 2,3-bisphosphoglycerate-independent phosphoglycerate mutase [Ruminococcus sp.]|jgi:2,3-bisphosphoglycerate-independent phosphoglycerate mutase|nr:2,3-bisphosphoglycerate-independent phosphoglycerate mutase [Ruminococcus sp.]
MDKKLVSLIILDGYGYNESDYGNAVKAARTPNLDKYFSEYPHTLIGASGMDVGLPDGQMGNSEVGHTNIGAGRIVYQELTRITKSISDGDFFTNSAFTEAVENCKKKNSALHLMGLLSDGGVHSHNEHLYGLLKLAKENGLSKVFVHCFMDGRDVPPMSGLNFVKELISETEKIGVGKIATISGRYYAMDRDKRWERVTKAYDAMVNGIGVENSSPTEVMQNSYDNGITDEFIVPAVICKDGTVKDGDSIIFFNFRPDRAREITRTFVDKEFSGFDTKNMNLKFVCMTQYDVTMPNVSVAFKPEGLDNTFGEYISKNGMNQLRIAETEKYAHVTFFFNGGVEKPYENEDRILVESPKVSTYDLQPEMSAYPVCDKVVEAIGTGKYNAVILNYANCDMVGHTGVFDAAVKAVEAVDTCVGKTVQAILEQDGVAIITADHGNADKMYEPDGSPFTAHTTNPVPLAIIGADDLKLRSDGVLADLSPTMLQILGKPQPKEMTGSSLII